MDVILNRNFSLYPYVLSFFSKYLTTMFFKKSNEKYWFALTQIVDTANKSIN